jgi:hypothetical protein
MESSLEASEGLEIEHGAVLREPQFKVKNIVDDSCLHIGVHSPYLAICLK